MGETAQERDVWEGSRVEGFVWEFVGFGAVLLVRKQRQINSRESLLVV